MPDEITELKDDIILLKSDNMIITKWNVLKPRNDIDHGISAYFMDMGIKVSKVFNKANILVYWYCDIIETKYDASENSYIFNDLLIDVLIYPDEHVEVVDIDEFADIMDKGTLPNSTIATALRQTNSLLKLIYSGKFNTLTKYITDIENKTTRSEK